MTSRLRRTWLSAALIVLAGAALVLGPSGAGTFASASTTSASSAQTAKAAEKASAKQACAIPHSWLLRTWRGWRADRSGNVIILPKVPNFVGSGLPHVGPWPYTQDVPMLWYGPGHVPALGKVNRPVTSAGIAPTEGEMLNYPFKAIDGQPMSEAVSKSNVTDPPKLLVVYVWDAGGRDVLDANPKDWPYLKSLIPKGVWYEHATVGSSPTSTAQIHTTIGTGAFPDDSGLVGHRLTIGPNITTPWARGPGYIDLPTFADLYDRAMGNKPIVGLMGTVTIHGGMMGHGAMWGGGDKDIAMFRQAIGGSTLGDETFRWNLPGTVSPYYTFPSYVNDVPGFKQDVHKMDEADGKLDGKWRNNPISQLLNGFDTPARIPYQEQVIEQVIKREHFGQDSTPDLLYINHKMIDYISHVWTMNSPEMSDAVKAEDSTLHTFVQYLNRQVGKGQWAMLLTADHGAIPKPSLSGAWQISSAPIAAGINAKFGTPGKPVVRLVQPTQIFLNESELHANGYDDAEVAQWVMTMTEAQTMGPGALPPKPADAGDKVFQAAFPGSMMEHLSCLPEAKKGYGP